MTILNTLINHDVCVSRYHPDKTLRGAVGKIKEISGGTDLCSARVEFAIALGNRINSAWITFRYLEAL